MNKLSKNLCISNTAVILKTFRVNNISKKYIDNLNDFKINRYLEVRKTKQNKKTVTKYILNHINSTNKHMFQIRDKKRNKFIGTVTLDIKKKNYCYLGYMISDYKYWGTKYSIIPFELIIKYIFQNLMIKNIICTTLVNNIGVVIFLKKFDFKKISNETSKNLYFKLFKKIKKNNINMNILKNEKTKK